MTVDLSKVPATTAPDGQTSNLINPPSIANQMTACNIVCAVIVVIVVALRMFTRIRIVKSLGYDDYILLFSIVVWFSDLALFQILPNYGMGKHLWNVSVADFSPGFLRLWVIAAIMYSGAILFIKLSILFFYRRLFTIQSFSKRWWAVTFFTVGYSIGGIFASMFACTPVAASWDITITDYTCIDKSSFYIVNAVFNCVSDLLILCLPLPVVWKLALDYRQKVTLSIVFALGSVSCVVSILRLKSIIVFLQHGNSDITYDLEQICLWSEIETTVGVICACAPTLRPFFYRYLGSFFSSMGSNRGISNKYTPNSGPAAKSDRYGNFSNGNFYSRRARGEDLELGVQKNTEAIVTVNGRDDDADSTDRIIKGDHRSEDEEDEGRAGGPLEIKIQQSYQVYHTSA